METFSTLLAICAGNSVVPGEFPTQRPVMQNFDVFFDLRPNKQLSKQWWGWWVETPSSPLWRHCNVVGEPPMGLPMPARSHQSRPKRTSMLVPISPKRGIFSMGNADSRNQEKGGSFYYYFWKTEFPQFNYPRWWYNIHLQVINSWYRCFVQFIVVFLSFNKKNDTDLMAHV